MIIMCEECGIGAEVVRMTDIVTSVFIRHDELEVEKETLYQCTVCKKVFVG